ncbi:Thioredoxin [compost metagenome]
MEILKFYSTTCGPCKMLAPVVKTVSEENGVQVTDINIEDQFEIAEQYGVMKVPTLVFLKDGKEVDRVIGFINKENLTNKLI